MVQGAGLRFGAWGSAVGSQMLTGCGVLVSKIVSVFLKPSALNPKL